LRTEQNRSSAGTFVKQAPQGRARESGTCEARLLSSERRVRVRVEKLSSNLFVTVHTERNIIKTCGRVGTATYRIGRIVA